MPFRTQPRDYIQHARRIHVQKRRLYCMKLLYKKQTQRRISRWFEELQPPTTMRVARLDGHSWGFPTRGSAASLRRPTTPLRSRTSCMRPQSPPITHYSNSNLGRSHGAPHVFGGYPGAVRRTAHPVVDCRRSRTLRDDGSGWNGGWQRMCGGAEEG